MMMPRLRGFCKMKEDLLISAFIGNQWSHYVMGKRPYLVET